MFQIDERGSNTSMKVTKVVNLLQPPPSNQLEVYFFTTETVSNLLVPTFVTIQMTSTSKIKGQNRQIENWLPTYLLTYLSTNEPQ